MDPYILAVIAVLAIFVLALFRAERTARAGRRLFAEAQSQSVSMSREALQNQGRIIALLEELRDRMPAAAARP